VLDEAPHVGRDANIDARRGYFTAFPQHVIYPRFLTATADRIAVLEQGWRARIPRGRSA
jgi:hypothetical protein